MKSEKSMSLRVFAIFLSIFPLATAAAKEGMQVIESHHDLETTVERLVTTIEERDMTVFSRIDHASNAAHVGESLPATQLITFGDPETGTALMQCGRSVAIDLPMKSLIWEEGDRVWLGYNDIQYLADRHNLENCDRLIQQLHEALLGLMGTVAGR